LWTDAAWFAGFRGWLEKKRYKGMKGSILLLLRRFWAWL
jgi:hypothetical protein